jgi:predicted ATPase
LGPDGGEFVQALLAVGGSVGTPSGRVSRGERTVKAVADSLKKMKLIDAFRIERVAPQRRDWEIRLRKSQSSAEVLLPDVGFGVSQVLPVLVLCYYAAEGSTLIIEQPELHLHPAAQSELADVLIDVVKNRRMQVIVESHSEHLLRRLQRRIAEEQFPAHDAALYFCEMENGASKATPLEITQEGFIKNWPKDFFGDEMGDLAAITEGAMNRRMSRNK